MDGGFRYAGALCGWAAEVTAASDGAPVAAVAWVRQVHGSEVVTVPAPGGTGGGPVATPGAVPEAIEVGTADGMVTAADGPALAVLTADCASVALGSPEGVHGAVHAGWKGLVAGVVPRAVAAMRAAGATRVVAALGPCIHAECYEFGEEDLARVAEVLGPGVRARTAAGRPALDIPAAVSAALGAAGAVEVPGEDRCTACGAGYFSHRLRADTGRQALLVWSPGPSGAPVERW